MLDISIELSFSIFYVCTRLECCYMHTVLSEPILVISTYGYPPSPNEDAWRIARSSHKIGRVNLTQWKGRLEQRSDFTMSPGIEHT